MKLIKRHYTTSLEIRETDSGAKVLHGTAVVFDSLSQDLGGFREKVSPSALDWTLENIPLTLLHGHNSLYVLGSQEGRTLDINVSKAGLEFECEPPDTQWARDLIKSIERRDVNGCSFGFNIMENGAQWTEEDNEQICTLTRIAMPEISITPLPAYTATNAEVRDYLAATGAPKALRDAAGAKAEAPKVGEQEPSAGATRDATRTLDLMSRRLRIFEAL